MFRRTLLLALPSLTLAGCVGMSPGTEQPTIVFFNADSAALDETAVGLLRSVATRAARSPEAPVRVLGFAGPTGGQAFNTALSRARAEHVATLLTEAGVARSRIRVGSRGPVPFEMAEQESRRVEIRIGE